MKLSPTAAAIAERIADIVTSRMVETLPAIIAKELATFAPTCACETPLPDSEECAKCGRRVP